jgi:hypothetical protein
MSSFLVELIGKKISRRYPPVPFPVQCSKQTEACLMKRVSPNQDSVLEWISTAIFGLWQRSLNLSLDSKSEAGMSCKMAMRLSVDR